MLAGCQPLCVDPRVAPREATLAGEQERIGEVFERRAQLLDREQQFLRSHSSIAGLDRRDGLPVLEAEQTCHAVLGEFPLFAQRFDSRAAEGKAARCSRHGSLESGNGSHDVRPDAAS